MKVLWLVCYDISDNQQRAAVHRRLKDYGEALQYSLFACELDSASKQALRAELATMIEVNDSIRWYAQCAWCRERVNLLGTAKKVSSTDYFIL